MRPQYPNALDPPPPPVTGDAALACEREQRRAAEEALRRLQHDLTDFFDNAAIGFHRVNADGVVLQANRAQLAITGCAAEQYVGRRVTELYVDSDVVEGMLARLARGDAFRDQELRLRCADGSFRYVLVDANGLWEDGEFVHSRWSTRDVTNTREAEQAQRLLAAIVDWSDDAIVSKRLDGVVTSWNRGAERIFGYSAAEMIGQPISRIIPPERQHEFPRILETIGRGERIDHFESERIRKDGRRIHVSLTVSPVRDATGKVIGASKIARDISDRKLAETERDRLLRVAEQARADAEAASRAKDEFLSVVSHELRTPLAAILGWVNVLKGGATGDRARRAVETIERSGRAQAKLIEDLLDASRMITGNLRLDLRLVDLANVMQQAANAIRPTADVKGVRLEVDLDPAAGPVAGDADRLQQVAWNLLSNAVKFTPAGGVVRMELVRDDATVRLAVRDTGIGIPVDFLPLVFERFRQAKRVQMRGAGGLGLGLAIVRHLVELHGGMVTAGSDGEGQGAVFTVVLPLAPAVSEVPAGMPSSRVLDGLRVLVVDDNADTLEALQAVLQAHGARVTGARSVQAARALLGDEPPDVLISDILMPDEDGYALARELRTTAELRHMPAIAITGQAGEESARRAANAGFQVHIVKPVDPGLLVAAVSNLTTRSRLSLAH